MIISRWTTTGIGVLMFVVGGALGQFFCWSMTVCAPTNRGVGSTLAMAEYAVAGILHFAKSLDRAVLERERGAFDHGNYRPLLIEGKTACVVGAGGIGSKNTTWFIAFAPVGAPRVAIAVVLQDQSGSGGTTAAPIAKAVMEAILAGKSNP